jgi:hypothetical protein
MEDLRAAWRQGFCEGLPGFRGDGSTEMHVGNLTGCALCFVLRCVFDDVHFC